MLAYQKGDANAFCELLTRHKRPVFAFVLRSVRQHQVAEELFQDVFTKVIESAPRYTPAAKFRTWVYTIARNVCVDHARRQTHRRTDALNEPSTPEPLAASAEMRMWIEQALDRLPVEQREVFVMREVAELSFDEIAQVINCPIGTVKSRMRYALHHLREALRDNTPSEPLARQSPRQPHKRSDGIGEDP